MNLGKIQLLQEALNSLEQKVKSLEDENMRLSQTKQKLERENQYLRTIEQELLSALELAFLDKSDLEIMLDVALVHGDAIEKQLIISAEKAWYAAGIDELTQLPNRRKLLEYLDRMWRQMLRESSSLSLLMCDVDYFKPYNDFYGHQEGDNCLCRIAQAIARAVKRPIDLTARYGGEEFVVVLPGTILEGAVHVAECICQSIAEEAIPHQASQIADRITISIGVATHFPKKGDLPTRLIQAADEALFTAKRKGRNRIEIYQG